jgi:hypothetical protein
MLTLRILSAGPMWIGDGFAILDLSILFVGHWTLVVRHRTDVPARDQSTWRCKANFGEDVHELHKVGDSCRSAGESRVAK